MENINQLNTEILKIINQPEYAEAIREPCKIRYLFNKDKNKLRKLEISNDTLKEKFQKPITLTLQKQIERPPYCMSGWKGTNNILNASVHAGKRFTVTLDIADYFPNSKAKFVENFWKNQGFYGDELDRLVNLTTFESHLPTGAPTSNILAALIHKPLFDVIYKKMQEQGITFTTYVDDITLSSNNHIPNGVIKFIGSVLKTHGLRLNASKIKRFGYKGAFVTGVRTTQSGKLQMPFKQGHKVINMLRAKSIEEMTEEELRKLIGKIGYIQQITPSGTIKSKHLATDTKCQHRSYFYETKKKAFKCLNQITKTASEERRYNIEGKRNTL